MIRIGRVVLGTLGTAAMALGLAAAAGVALPYNDSDEAFLRLSFSARPERIEVCRQRSAAELEQLEPHMRLQMSCEGKFASYQLRVQVDDELIDESVVRGAGLRHDRPLYLLWESPIPTGRHRLRVSLTRRETPDSVKSPAGSAEDGSPTVADTGVFAGRAERESDERARRARAAIPAQMILDTVAEFAPNRVSLVTLDVERHLLRLNQRTIDD